MGKELRIGTRGSKLALWQANWVKSTLETAHPGLTVSLTIIKTRGDKILDVPLAKVGGKGLFVKEIEEALLDGRVDLAVHSMKDMPSELPPGLTIGPIPEREDPRDVLICRTAGGLDDLPKGAQVGTSSLRRAAQLRRNRPDLTIQTLRGNLDTRLRKLDEGQYDAIVLAAAGVRRLGLADRVTEYLDPGVMLPAVAQGALCIEVRADDPTVDAVVDVLNHPETRTRVMAERAFLHRLEGGCQVPIAGHAILKDNQIEIVGLVADLTGQNVIAHTLTAAPEAAESVGVELAERLLADGAGKILETLNAQADHHV